ncbi:hypothetical protein BDZ91DRAFT_318440 [Kalaharituber pfeilii]|nr:hypothetical protein BDZ91DRAFT_318440 [Kalaharituber pfeilii]
MHSTSGYFPLPPSTLPDRGWILLLTGIFHTGTDLSLTCSQTACTAYNLAPICFTKCQTQPEKRLEKYPCLMKFRHDPITLIH